MKFKSPATPDPLPEERDDVHVVANRCPFCRDDVSAAESMACRDCLTRHHPACWEESGSCGSCRGESAMWPDRAAPPTAELGLDAAHPEAEAPTAQTAPSAERRLRAAMIAMLFVGGLVVSMTFVDAGASRFELISAGAVLSLMGFVALGLAMKRGGADPE